MRTALFVSAALALASVSGVSPSSAAEKSVSPDGREPYKCGSERDSHSGCFTHWTRTADKEGSWGRWIPGWCPAQKPAGGLCWSGGVAWWYWRGPGKIGDYVLKDFWVRDYANLEDQNKSPENLYGDAIALAGQGEGCYQAGSFRVCMVEMSSKVSGVKPQGVPLPFAPNPKSFAQFISKQNWSGNSWQGKAEFLDLSGCDFGSWKHKRIEGSSSSFPYTSESNPYVYICGNGYARQSTPMGVKVCEVKGVYYWSKHTSPANDLVGKDRLVPQSAGFSVGECRFR